MGRRIKEILADLGSSRKYNFHGHTQYCDGRAEMKTFVKAALENGFSHYGFSPHSPIPISSPCNMSAADVELYLAELAELREEFGADIRLYGGMEVDYLGSMWGPAHAYFAELPLDYVIGSVHFIPTQEDTLVDVDGNPEAFKVKLHENFNDDLEYVVRTFFRQTVRMLEAGGLDILGHYDKITRNASAVRPGVEYEQWFIDSKKEATDAAIASGVVIEINTKIHAEGGPLFPDAATIRTLIRAGVPLLVNSDAHRPHMVNASREYVFGLLDAFSYGE